MKRVDRVVRQSQTISPFGVGAIFDVQGESFVGCDIFEWGGSGDAVRSQRLTDKLHVTSLRSAPVLTDNPYAKGTRGVPYARFPKWMFCQKCRRMTRWPRAAEQDGQAPACPVCTGSRRQLVPMRWVQICRKGHMSDINWKYWAHWSSTDPDQRQCERYDRLSFENVRGRTGGGLDTLQVRCRSCNASKSLSGITGTDTLLRMGMRCEGRQPWQPPGAAEKCEEPARAVQRGASNVYFPVTHSSIEIPNATLADTESDKAMEVRNSDWFPPLLRMDPASHMFNSVVENLATDVGVSDAFVLMVLAAEQSRDERRSTAVVAEADDLLAGEWAAFVTPWDNLDGGGDFITRHVELLTADDRERSDLASLEESVSKIVIADRLREVRVLEGFHRVDPAGADSMVKVSLNRRIDWLPAIEVFGEGIFISLNEARLAAWESRDDVRARAAELAERLGRHFMRDRLMERTGPALEPRYILLHTLGHLLIRRLAFESGYSAASLRERIYGKSATPGKHHEQQAGVLVYTAAGDSEGTLGGLALQGEPGRLSSTMATLLEEATWCSADPLCSENRAQGFGSLNYAACHACCLVSETSCESTNSLLDRALLVGAPGVVGYFSNVVTATTALAAAVSEDTA